MIREEVSNLRLAGRIHQGNSPLVMLDVAMHRAITDQRVTAAVHRCQRGEVHANEPVLSARLAVHKAAACCAANLAEGRRFRIANRLQEGGVIFGKSQRPDPTKSTHSLEVSKMKKQLMSLLLVVIILIALASPAFAGGDQNRGAQGQGAVYQHQVQDPPPFQP